MTIAAQVYALFAKGLNNKQVLESLTRDNPGCKTQMASIYWYRNEVKKGRARIEAKPVVDSSEYEEFKAWRAERGRQQEVALKDEYGM
jgi:hypothetical protein